MYCFSAYCQCHLSGPILFLLWYAKCNKLECCRKPVIMSSERSVIFNASTMAFAPSAPIIFYLWWARMELVGMVLRIRGYEQWERCYFQCIGEGICYIQPNNISAVVGKNIIDWNGVANQNLRVVREVLFFNASPRAFAPFDSVIFLSWRARMESIWVALQTRNYEQWERCYFSTHH